MSEWIGLIGGLAGTVLGWLLSILSLRGRLHIYSEWKERFECDDDIGGIKECSSSDQAKYYSYNLSLDLYNGSGEPKIMRKIEVIFLKGRRIVFHDTPEDESTKRFTGAVWNYDPVLPITISAKTVVHINLRGGMNDSDERMNKIWEADRVKLIYRNTRNKLKSIMIQKKDYLHCFDSNSNIVDS